MSIPSLTRTMDDDFVNTWLEIQPKVVDNILEATVLWLALKEYGCLKTQVGGEYITRTIGYGTKSTQRFQKGSVLSQSAPKLDTMGMWQWRYFAVDVNRSLVDDQKNAGKYKIKSYIARRLEAARNAVTQDFEQKASQWSANSAGIADFTGLFDICAPTSALTTTETGGTNSDAYNSGTSNGGLDRSNAWWQNKQVAGTAPYSYNLVADMRSFYRTVHNNQEAPNFILCDGDLYEAYEDEAADKQQIVMGGVEKRAIDLGFDVMRFKGAMLTWTDYLSSTYGTARTMLMLNLNHIEFVYDPRYWFEMTNWKESTNQLERVAYIVCVASGLITDQPRRHGYMLWAS